MVQTCRSPALSGRLGAYMLIGLAGLMSGCGKKPEARPPVAQAPARPPAKPAIPLPPRTPGLWDMTVTEEGSEDAPQILQICIDANTDKHLGILGTDLSGDHCQKTVNKVDGDAWGILAACHLGNNVTSEYSGSVSGDFTTAYAMKLRSQTTATGPNPVSRVTNYAVAAKRLGDCASDQRPGDVINDGVRFNLFDMAGVKTQSASSAASAAPADEAD